MSFTSPPTMERPADVAPAVAAKPAIVVLSSDAPYVCSTAAIIPSCMGTRTTASAKRIGVAPAVPAAVTAAVILASTCLFFREASICCAAVSASSTF